MVIAISYEPTHEIICGTYRYWTADNGQQVSASSQIKSVSYIKPQICYNFPHFLLAISKDMFACIILKVQIIRVFFYVLQILNNRWIIEG